MKAKRKKLRKPKNKKHSKLRALFRAMVRRLKRRKQARRLPKIDEIEKQNRTQAKLSIQPTDFSANKSYLDALRNQQPSFKQTTAAPAPAPAPVTNLAPHLSTALTII